MRMVVKVKAPRLWEQAADVLSKLESYVHRVELAIQEVQCDYPRKVESAVATLRAESVTQRVG